jgi:hypothetical protein
MIFTIILAVLCGSLILTVTFGTHQFVTSIQPTNEQQRIRPTKLDRLIEAYMKSDPADVSATIEFLLGAETLTDPFAEAPAPAFNPPPKPSDAATSARPAKFRRGAYDVIDDLERSYAMTYGVPTFALQCQLCGEIGSFSSGTCHACGGRATHPSWVIWHEGSGVDYYDKQKMEVDAYRMQKAGNKITVFDSNGKQLFVAPSPRLIQERHRTRDKRGRFVKQSKHDCECGLCSGTGMIYPMDEPYPIRPPLPGKLIRA